MEIDERFMSNKYVKYKDFIIKKLGFEFKHQPDNVRHDIESWIRDYYVDGMSEYDCLQAIQDQFRDLRESIEILENNGYIVE